MTKKNNFLTILFVLILVLGTKMQVQAVNTGFEVEAVSREEKNMVSTNIQLSLLTTEPEKKGIDVFDVNEGAMIAVGQFDGGSGVQYIAVYSQEGIFQYGYSFISSGAFGIDWDGDNILLYVFRAQMIVAIDPQGEIVDVVRVLETPENNDYRNHEIFARKKVVGNVEYTIKNDIGFLEFFASSYSQLTATPANGEEIILYDVNDMQLRKMICKFILGVSVAIVGICVAIWAIIKEQKNLRSMNS